LPRRFRLLEWLWLGSARKRASEARPSSPRALELSRRAELAAELAERARRPAEALIHGSGDPLACELYAEAVCWALSAQRVAGDEASPAPAAESKLSVSTEWERADPALLLRAAGNPEALERMRAGICDKTFVDFAELERREQVELATRLAGFVSELLNPLRSERVRVARILMLRLVRLGSVALALAALSIGIWKARGWYDEWRDLAPRASWTTSSLYPVGGCPQPAQTCKESPYYFFHTYQEDSPFVLFDLGKEKTLSSVVIENRLDCCNDRAVPLLIEVSSDNRRWKKVKRRDAVFTTWKAKFPAVRARYVKIRVQGPGILHLSRVRLLG